MTASTTSVIQWADRPAGKVMRVAVAVCGMIFATLILMNAALVASSGSWALILLGVGVAVSAVRVAQEPTLTRMMILGALIVAVPLSMKIF